MIKFILNHHRLPVKFALLGVAFLAGSPIAKPQELLTQKVLSVDAALSIARSALDKCHADGYRVSLTVLDGSGLIKVQVRGDGTGPHTLEHSRRKAYTALTFKRTSAETAKAWAASPIPLLRLKVPWVREAVRLSKLEAKLSERSGLVALQVERKMKLVPLPGSRRLQTC